MEWILQPISRGLFMHFPRSINVRVHLIECAERAHRQRAPIAAGATKAYLIKLCAD